MGPANFQQLANFIWPVADLLRGPQRYERVMLPLTVPRRLDAVPALNKAAVLNKYRELEATNARRRAEGKEPIEVDAILNNLARDEDGRPLGFHNHSPLDFHTLKGDSDNYRPPPRRLHQRFRCARWAGYRAPQLGGEMNGQVPAQ